MDNRHLMKKSKVYIGVLLCILILAGCETQESEQNTRSIFDELAQLEYHQYTCDGLPEYSLTADDGTTYYMNFSEKWVWRGKGEQEAELPDRIISWLEANRDTVSMENLNEDKNKY